MSVNIFEYIQCEWICPITQLPIKDPVITEDGQTYQRTAIVQWLSNSSKSPQTGLSLESKKLIPNRALKATMAKFSEFMNKLQTNYKRYPVNKFRDFGRLQQIIQQFFHCQLRFLQKFNLIKRQTTVSSEVYKRQNTSLHSSLEHLLEQEINSIMKQIQISYFDLASRYIKTCQLLIDECKKENFQTKIDWISDKYNLKNSKNQNEQSKQKYTTQSSTSQSQSGKILQSPLLIQFDKNECLRQLQIQQETLRHPFQYLLDTFKSEKQIKARYQINNFTQLSSLEHQRVALDIHKFLQYDWRQLKAINLMDCGLIDLDWQFMVNNGQRFPNLREIKIYENKIREIREGDLDRFKSLQSISFYTYGGWTNPLSEQTKAYLRSFRQSHPHIHILFQQ